MQRTLSNGQARARVRAMLAMHWMQCLMACALSMGVVANAHATISETLVAVSRDGSPGWDTNSTTPGFDSHEKNGIVRTNDLFEYIVTLSTVGVDTNTRIVVTLPKGDKAPTVGAAIARWNNVPATCVSGAISADGQTLTCNIGTIASSGTTSYYFAANVLGTTPNGTKIAPPTFVVSSDAGPAPASVTPPATLTVTAAPFYDVVFQTSRQGNPQAYAYYAGGGPNNADGYYHKMLVGLMGRNPNGNGNKGVEQLNPNQPINITADFSGYPAGVLLDNWHNGNSNDGTPAAGGTFAAGCGNPSLTSAQPSAESGGLYNMYDLVGDNGNANNSVAIVPNGGTCQVTSSSSAQVSVSITGTDTRMMRQPAQRVSTGSPVSASEWWVLNKGVVLWTPATSYPPNVAVQHIWKLGSISANSISGQAITGNVVANDSVTYPILRTATGNASKQYYRDLSVAAPYATECNPAVTSNCFVDYMTPGQSVTSYVRFQNNDVVKVRNAQLCEVIDRTAFDIGPNFLLTASTSDTKGTATYEYGARATGSPYFASTDSADPNTGVIGPGGGPNGVSEYALATCGDPSIRWFATTAEAQAAGGLVYVRATFDEVNGAQSAILYVRGLVLRSTYAATIQVLSPNATTRTAGQPIAAGTVLRNVGRVLNTTYSSLDVAQLRDHLLVQSIKTTTRIAKSLISGDSNAPQPVGAILTFRLSPRYSTTFPPSPHSVTVTDVLPPGMTYVQGSATFGGTPMEPSRFDGDPATGYTRLVWTLPNRMPFVGPDATNNGSVLPPIEFKAKLAETLTDSVILPNAAATSGGASDYEADCAYATTTQTFGACAKAAAVNIKVQTPPGFRVAKASSTPIIEPGNPFTYDISFVSFGQPMARPDIPDLIDVLPYIGDGPGNPVNSYVGRTPASSFSAGAYTLSGVTVPSNDTGMQVYYTNRAPTQINNDPRDASNALPGGSTRWCLQSQLGTPDCPASIAEATAVRMNPAVNQMAANSVYTLQLHFNSSATLAHDGDIFANSVGARSVDPASHLLYVEGMGQPPVQVVSGGLSGRVFVDVSQNNVLDSGADTPLADVCVAVTGTTGGGSNVTYSMKTNAEGAYGFVGGAANTVFTSADCSGTAIPSFVGLLAGKYSVRETVQPTGWADGADYVGTVGGTAGSDQITDITLARGAKGIDYNFTERPLASVSGKVFLDINGNGVNDGGLESPLPKVRIAIGNGTTTWYTCTAADGTYGFSPSHAVYATDPGPTCGNPGTPLADFSGFQPGNYSLTETTPPNYAEGSAYPGNAGGTAAQPNGINGIALGAGTVATGYNFTEKGNPPVAVDDSGTGTIGQPVTIKVLGNDTDPNNNIDPTKTVIVDPPAGSTLSSDGKSLTVPGEGVWTVDPTTGDITFTPESGFTGDPTPIHYTVTDTTGLTSNPAKVTIDYNQSPSFNMVKTAAPTSVSAPGTITYTFAFTNNGNVPLKNLTLTDANIDAGSLQGCPIATLAVGTTANCTATRTVTQAMINAGTAIVNTASPTAQDNNGNPVNEDNDGNPSTSNDPADNTATVSVSQMPSFNMIKKANPASVNAPGAITYTFEFINNGNVPLQNLSVTDANIDAGTLSGCPIANLPIAGTASCTATRTVTQAMISSGANIVNTAVPSGQGPNGQTVNEDNDGDPSTPNDPSDNTAIVSVNKDPPVAVDDSGKGTVGQPVTLNVLANDSDPNNNIDPTKTVFVNPPAGSSLSNDGKTLTVPGEGVWTIDPTTGAMTFTPQAGFTGDPTPITYTVTDTTGLTSNPAKVTIDYDQKPSYNMVKTNDKPTIDTVGVITYTFTFTNNGNVPLFNLTVADASIDANSLMGCPIAGPLAPAATASCTATRAVTLDMLKANQPILNTATPSATTGKEPNSPVAPEDNDGDPTTPNDPADNTTSTKVVLDPPVAVNDQGKGVVGQPATVNAVLNDSDPNNNLDPATLNVDPASVPGGVGTDTDGDGDIDRVVVAGQGVWSVAPNGVVTFTPEAGYSGDPTPIRYTVKDTTGLVSNPATITIDYEQRPPVARDDSKEAPDLSIPVTQSVVANDNDPDGDLAPATVNLDPSSVPGGVGTDTDGDGDIDRVVVPGQGTWVVDNLGNATFTPESGFYANPTPIVYTIKDRSGLSSNPAKIAVTYPARTAQLLVEKRGSTREAEVGDRVTYTVTVRNVGNVTVFDPSIVDRLPAGFRLMEGSIRVDGATLKTSTGAPGPVITMLLDRVAPNGVVTITYSVRLAVGAQQGDGVNRVQAQCTDNAKVQSACSNEGQWKVTVRGGVFSNEGCIVGQIYVDCNYNSMKDREELGIPGVRMYLEDGTYLVSDVEGKYSYCGVRPTTHVLKVDPTTLPTRSRLVTSSNRNVGDANSLFVDLKNGEMQRADFIEGSCNNEVIEQVKARRAQGESGALQTERGQPKLKFESKPVPQGNPLQQGTDAANQKVEQTREVPPRP